MASFVVMFMWDMCHNYLAYTHLSAFFIFTYRQQFCGKKIPQHHGYWQTKTISKALMALPTIPTQFLLRQVSHKFNPFLHPLDLELASVIRIDVWYTDKANYTFISQLRVCVACYMDYRYVWAAQLTFDNISVDEPVLTSRNVCLVCIDYSHPAVSPLMVVFFLSWIPPGSAHSASETE